jgi:RNA polymerase sigma-70 factor (ECF subfamily)
MTGAKDTEIPRSEGGASFTTTHWSVVLNAGDPSSPQAAEALNALCQTYWYPLYAYLRREGRKPETAADLTQGFFARLLRLGSLAQVRREKGKFRSFLLASLKHFVRDEHVRADAMMRGGGMPLVSLDDTTGEDRYQREPVSDLDPEKLYERRWAMTLLAQAKARLKAEYAGAGKAELYDRLNVLESPEPNNPLYAEVAAELGRAEGTVKSDVSRMRHRYRQLVRAEVANTVADPAEVDDEIRYLIRVISR